MNRFLHVESESYSLTINYWLIIHSVTDSSWFQENALILSSLETDAPAHGLWKNPFSFENVVEVA